MNERKTEISDRINSEFIACYFVCMMVFTVSKRLLGNDSTATIISAIIAFPYLIWKGYLVFEVLIVKKMASVFVLMTIVVTSLYLFTMIRGMSCEVIIPNWFSTIVGIIFLLITFNIENISIVYLHLLKAAPVILGVGVFIIFVSRDVAAYSMRFSYLILIPLCCHTTELIKRKKKRYIFAILLALFLILFYGSRGPIACYVVYVLFQIFFALKKWHYKIMVMFLVLFCVVEYYNLGNAVIAVMDKFGLQSRTLSLFFTDIGHLSGRNFLVEEALQMIDERPILGWGIAGEYFYMENYPHNFLLELCIHYGIIVGGVIFISFLLLFLNAAVVSKNVELDVLLIFFSYGFVILLFSSSYLGHDGFYILLGLIFRKVVKKRHGKAV